MSARRQRASKPGPLLDGRIDGSFAQGESVNLEGNRSISLVLQTLKYTSHLFLLENLSITLHGYF